MRFSAFKEDLQKQKNGAAIPIGVAVFYCKRWGTKESEEFLAKLRREIYGPFIANSDEYFPELLAWWLAEYAITGWEGIFQEGGDALLKYNKDTARQIFLDPSYWLQLNAELFRESQNYERYLEEMAKEDLEELKK